MKVVISHRIEHKYSDNSESNILLLNELTGGSDTEFETPAAPPTENVENDFTIKEIEKFDPVLEKGNTLSVDILSILNMPFADLAFIDIFCFTTNANDNNKPVPVRFKVVLNDGANDMELGDMSHFALTNIKSNLIQKITISDIDVLEEDTVQLIVTAGSKNKNA